MLGVTEIQASQWESEVVNVEGPVVVDFWHHMCAWCQKLNPIFAQLPEAFLGVKFFKVNILESPENRKIAIDSGVMSTPTIKVFCEGRPIGDLVGFKSHEKLVHELNEILNQKDSCLDQSTPLEA
jgi:thioredoxin 1